MRKRTAVFWAIAALSIGILTLTFVACGGDKNLPTGDSGMPTSSAPAPAPVATNPQPAPNPIGAPGIDVALVSSTFDPDRCTDLTQPQHSGKTELVEVAKVTNNTDREVYAKPAIYHSDIATCGALDTNPGGIVGLMEAENIPPGQSKNWTHRFTIPENACGAYQFDNDAKNGVISRSTLGNGDGGKVINTGRNCPSCEAFNVQLTVTGEGLTRTVKVTFAGQKPAKKALVDFGDGTSAELTNGQSVSHTWKYGEYIVKATLEAEGISCYNSTIVKNEEQCVPEWKELEPEITYGEWGECKKPAEASASNGEPQCSQSRTVRTVIKEKNSCTNEVRVKSDKTTTESRECKCVSCDSYSPPPITGDIDSDIQATQVVFDKGTVTSNPLGVFDPTLPKTVARPAAGQPEGSFSTTYTVTYGPAELKCKASREFTKPVPPQDRKKTCDDYEKPSITGDIDSDIQATQVVFDKGTVSPSGGSFSPSLPATVARPAAGQPAGSFSTTYTLPYGPEELKCSVSKSFTKPVSPKDDTCDNYQAPLITGSPSASTSATQVTVSAGSVGPSGGTFNPSVPFSVNRPPNGQPAGEWNLTYTLPYGPSALKCTTRKDFSGPVPPKDPECDPSEFRDQSLNWNKNVINANVHVGGNGNWELKLFATSSTSEYPDYPDYTKDTDSVCITCKGQGELKVDYNWKDHPSRYWWAALYKNGNRVWLSQRVDKQTESFAGTLALSYVAETPSDE